ncbi:MAG: hypothetical protein J5I81_09670 [Nitrococcus mobilis]|nr:hypothetical protein [Nitrococcus mobilis]
METSKNLIRSVTPAKAGVHLSVSKGRMDSDLRRNDGIGELFDIPLMQITLIGATRMGCPRRAAPAIRLGMLPGRCATRRAVRFGNRRGPVKPGQLGAHAAKTGG